MAFAIPLDFFSECLVKNETVNGIIGKTQGVNKAINPPKKPSPKIVHNPDFDSRASPI